MARVAIQRGDVVRVDLRGAEGVEKQKTRPCVVVQNDTGNAVSPMTIVVPLTDMSQYKHLPVQVLVTEAQLGALATAAEWGLQNKDGIVECGHVRSIDRHVRIDATAGVLARLDADVMERVDAALRVSLGL